MSVIVLAIILFLCGLILESGCNKIAQSISKLADAVRYLGRRGER